MEPPQPLLASFLQDLGYGCTFSANVILAVLEQLQIYPSNASVRITPQEIGAVLAMMAKTHSGLPDNPTLSTLTSGILDENSLALLEQMQTWNLELFFPLVKKMDMSTFPTNVFLERWKNRSAQIGFLTQAVQIAPEVFTLSKYLSRHVVSKETFPFNNSTRFFFNSSIQSCWNSLDLCELLVDYGESGYGSESSGALVEIALEQSPDLLLLAFSMMKAPWSSLIKELGPKLVHSMLGSHLHAQFILPRVWELNRSMFISGILLMYNTDNTTLSRILDIAQEMKNLAVILENKHYAFTIDLASLASRREYLNLEKWLQDRIRAEGEPFIRACLEFLNEKVITASAGRPDSVPVVPLPLDVTTTFLRILHSYGGSLSSENAEYKEKIFGACTQLISRMEGSGPSAADESLSDATTFPPEIEEEVNAFYEKIYKGELSVAQVVDLLQRLKLSSNPRDLQTFKCMIHNLFDEYKFFARYPDRELLITSVLFGVLIQNQIVTSMALGVALRYVLEALRQPVGSKLFQFGIQALAQFRNRLTEWPQYCSLILQIDHLHQTHPEVIHLIQTIQKQGMVVQPEQGTTAKIPSPPLNDGSLFTALQLHGILPEHLLNFDVPSDVFQEKILFIVNNVSGANVAQKAQEFAEVLQPQHVRWFCNYIVTKRASIEPNFHATYVSFLSHLAGFPMLSKAILFETLSRIKDLVNSEKTVNSSQERSYLKNLGAWLGAITLAKNKPIKHKNIAFKHLLMEGFEHKRLIVVIPFVCKVLEQCGSSKVFNPPNPWLMGIMRFLAELYHYAELKLNLKFEIEVLCKNIKLDIKDITPSETLRNWIQNAGRRDSERDSGRVDGAGFAQPSDDDAAGGYPNLASFIVFNSNIPLFSTQPSLKRIVHIAIDRSIRDAVQSPVLERSVSIAVVATREIVIKDFALEQNEERMRKAAQYMVQSLAGSLASVSSRETLKISMISNLRSLLAANGFTDQTVPEQVIFVIVADNLDLACSVMEKAAAEKSIPEIDESLANCFMSRRKHREQRTAQPFYDPLAYASSHFVAMLPEPLRLKPSGLTAQQMRVYEDFMRIPNATVSAFNEASRPLLPRQEIASTQGHGLEGENPAISIIQVIEKAPGLVNDLDRLLAENASAPLQSLSAQHPVKIAVQQLFWLISQSGNPDESCLIFSEKIVKALFLSESLLAREVYILVLRRLADFSKPLANELAEWFMYSTDVQKQNVAVTFAILNADIITCLELDLHLSRQLEIGSDGFLKFAMDLLRECCLAPNASYSYIDFLHTFETLRRSKSFKSKEVELFLADVNARSALSRFGDVPKDGIHLKEHYIFLFKEWFTAFCHPASSEKFHLDFVSKLYNTGLFLDESFAPLFFRTSVELSVESFTSIKLSGTTSGNPYQAIDAFSRLAVLLIVNNKDQSHGDTLPEVNFAVKILSVIVLVLVHSQEQNPNDFDQKPFLRIFSSILNDLKPYEMENPYLYQQLLCSISNTLHTLRPTNVPTFSFSWVQLICHRNYLSCVLLADGQKYWPYFHRLLVDLLEFLCPYLRSGQLTPTTRMLYRATLRVFLILLHDFPDFLSGYHLSLVDLLPPSCIQLRNLILSAFPPDMRLPDPFTPNLKVDLLPEMKQPPQILFDYTQSLISTNLKQDIDFYLKTKSPSAFLSVLGYSLLSKDPMAGGKYDVSIVNALVLYLGVQSIRNSGGSHDSASSSAATDIFQQLLADLDSEVANQLRFPNSQTHFFSCLLLELFAKAREEIIKEQITREYEFWEHSSFINSAPEIETLFQNVAKSMQTPK
ncbi:hypothetical protein HDV03_001870 [Kappamyces sp. JEL0829]|nr:hypothetical protein HDV03_001870 [Kappamyces sp. JEL0829]